MPKRKHPRIAVALGGGAAWCISQIGVLMAFEEAGIPIHAVAGTSGGSIIGALYADGFSPDELAQIVEKSKLTEFIRPTVPKTGFFDSKAVASSMRKKLRHKNIEDMPIPFCAVATDLQTGDKVTITEGMAAEAVRASCSIPVLFTPVKAGERILVDGGVVSAVPVNSAIDTFRPDITVAVNVNYRKNDKPELGNIYGIAYHLTMMLIRGNTRLEMPKADVKINVYTDGIGPHEIGKHAELIKRGYEAGRDAVKDVEAML